jgi:ADP-ribose pyrophosphatase
MLKKLNNISREIIYSNPYWDYNHDRYQLPNDSIGDYFYVNSRGSSMVIPMLNDESFILTKQFRYLNQKESIEFPGGGLKIGLSPMDNAKAELEEETGYKSNNVQFIGEFNPMNGVSNEICSVFLATGLSLFKPSPEITEEFEIINMTKEEINSNIKINDIWDGMTLACWALFLSHF